MVYRESVRFPGGRERVTSKLYFDFKMDKSKLERDIGQVHRPTKYVMKRRGAKPIQEQGIMERMMYYVSESRLRGKIRRINDALESDPVYVDTLRDLAVTPDGLVTNDIRRRVWPKLLGVNVYDIPRSSSKKREGSEDGIFRNHRDWHQVNLDVDRSHRRFPPEMRASRRRDLQRQLVNCIMRVLSRSRELHYYQGYHDIAVTFLLIMGEDLAAALLEKMSLHQIRDFMDVNMERTNQMLSFIHPIIAEADPELEEFLIRSDVGQLFALPWLITWFGHVMKDFNTIVRVYDFFLATHPLMPVYFSAALVIHRRNEILECDCEMSSVHHLLSRMPHRMSDLVEELIIMSYTLYQKYSPEKMEEAARQYLKHSTAVAAHTHFIKAVQKQRPDLVLRHRKIHGNTQMLSEDSRVVSANQGDQSNPFVKVAVWTLTATMGTMMLYVLSSSKRWI